MIRLHAHILTYLPLIVDYASKPGKAQQDPTIIAKRKRQLQHFLNRVMAHAILKKCHQLHLFLKGEGVWSDIVASAGLKRKPTNMMETTTKLRKPGMTFYLFLKAFLAYNFYFILM